MKMNIKFSFSSLTLTVLLLLCVGCGRSVSRNVFIVNCTGQYYKVEVYQRPCLLGGESTSPLTVSVASHGTAVLKGVVDDPPAPQRGDMVMRFFLTRKDGLKSEIHQTLDELRKNHFVLMICNCDEAKGKVE